MQKRQRIKPLPFSSFEIYQTKCAGIMKCASLLGDLVPTQIVGDLRFVTTFIEICPHGTAGSRGESGEEHPNKTVRDGINGFPAARDSFGDRLNGRILRDQAHQFIDIRSKTQEETSVGVALNIKITTVIFDGGKEKFQTAVLAYLVQLAGQLCSDGIFLGAEAYI